MALLLDDGIDPQRGDADVPDVARRVRRYGCMCLGCAGLLYAPMVVRGLVEHDDDLFPVYGPPKPHQPRHAAPSQETAA